MLTFLKRMKQSKKHLKGRFINIGLSSMQYISTLSTYACLIINLGQDGSMGMVIKMFAALGFMNTIDNMFVQILPKCVPANGVTLNASGVL